MAPPRISPRRVSLTRVLILTAAALLGTTGLASAQRFPEDPIEAFRDALLLEENKSLRYKSDLDEDGLRLALEFREENLKKAAANLKTLSQLARALLLTDWPRSPRTAAELRQESPFDRESRRIERQVREGLAREIVERAKKIATSGTTVQKITTAALIGEAVSSASELADEWRTLSKQLLELAPVLEEMTKSSEAAVRDAAARSIGQFPSSPVVAARVIKRLLTSNYPESTRRAAAEAFVALSEGVSTNQPARASEPGVSQRENRRNKQLFPMEDLYQVVEIIIPAGGVGLVDESLAVRRLCASGFRIAADAIAFEIRQLPNPPVYSTERESPYPPRERKRWSRQEIDRAIEGNKELSRLIAALMPALRAYRDQGEALTRATLDSDATVRLEARRTFDALARARIAIRDIRELAPKPPPKPAKVQNAAPEYYRTSTTDHATAALRRLAGQDPEQLPKLPRENGAGKDAKKADKGGPIDDKEDPISELLLRAGRAIASSGFRDPNPAARRAMIEAIEALGEPAGQYIESILTLLDDPDLFVRWVTARTLGKLAPLQPERVVPALIKHLDDEDIDTRMAMIRALGEYGPRAGDAVEPLACRLGKGDPEVRITLMKALEDIGQGAAPALPALARTLRDLNPKVRGEAARVIGRFGPAAAAYIKDLQPLTSDPDVEVRRLAVAAILNIQPDE